MRKEEFRDQFKTAAQVSSHEGLCYAKSGEKGSGQVLNAIPHVIWSARPDGFLEFVSDQWAKDYGGDAADFLVNGWLKHVHPDDVERAATNWNVAKDRPEPYKTEFRLRMPGGDYRWIAIRAKPELGPDGTVARWFGTCTDIDDRVLARKALEESERLYRGVLEASVDCIKILNLRGEIEVMNSPGLRVLEIDDFEQIRGAPWPSLWPEEMRATVAAAVRAALKGENERFSGFCPTAANEPKWWDVVVTPMQNSEGEVVRLLAISRDITSDRQKSQDLFWASEHDALTALPNRRAFQNRLHAATLRAMSSQNTLGLLIIDLDHFKHVNDTLGHPAGDALLREFAQRLRSCIRAKDFVARIGGDEFAIIVEDLPCATDLMNMGDSIAARLKAPLKIDGRVLSGGASVGGAVFPDDANSANELFKSADTALYALKSEGRGGTKLFKSHMREEAQRVSSQLSLARIALTEASVTPHFQTKVNLRTREPEGMEALLRWKHPRRGIQPPETIEEAFKDYELATKIGELMQTKVFADVAAWLKQGLQFGRVSINAAPVEFLRGDFAERFLQRLRAHQLSPCLFQVEITEHVLMERGSKNVAHALQQLNKEGVQIALDDFGTGYSSLSHLRDYPVDVVKIDKSFVARLGIDSEIEAIVRALVNLTKSLEIQSVAEGVETQAQADLLRAAGCDLAQGYLFGRPVEAEVVSSGVPLLRVA